MSIEEQLGTLTGTLKTFMVQYQNDRDDERESRHQFRDEIKESLGKIVSRQDADAKRIKDLEDLNTKESVPRGYFKFVLDLFLTGGILGVAAAAINKLMTKLGVLVGH